MTIAVCAASGQLGSAIVRALLNLDTDQTIVGLARTPSHAEDLGIEIRPGDYADRKEVERSLEGVDALLLVSGNGPPEARVEEHRNVIHAAKAAGVKRIVYTSIQGAEEGTAFSPVVQSNRQTEADIRASSLDWAIGRNGVYIEPDVEYLDRYAAAGEIVNCAGHARCGYTNRPELGYAYARLLTANEPANRTFNLHGEPITQTELAAYLSGMAGTPITYRAVSVAEYADDRTRELGAFIGPIIAGIYESIRHGALDNASDFEVVASRPHQGWNDYFEARSR